MAISNGKTASSLCYNGPLTIPAHPFSWNKRLLKAQKKKKKNTINKTLTIVYIIIILLLLLLLLNS